MSPPAMPIPRRLTRTDAANLLRRAKRATPDEDCECIGWAYCVMPESRAGQRLKIDHLLRTSNHEAADALLARTLMQQQDHPLMRLRFAQSLFAQGRTAQAHIEVLRVIKARPHCCRAHVLAARIARSMGDSLAADASLAKARALRPASPATQEALISALLETGHADDAAAELQRMRSPDAVLRAAVLRAQGRVLDAIDELRGQISIEMKPPARDELLSHLISVLDDAGESAESSAVQWRDVAAAITGETPASAIALARVMISRGDWQAAMELASQAAGSPGFKRTSMLIRTIADAYASLHAPHGIMECPGAASMWLTAMLGRLLRDIETGRDSGADPNTSMLQPMLHDAVAAFDAVLASRSHQDASSDRIQIERHRASCLQAMGLPAQVQSHKLVAGAPDSRQAETETGSAPLKFRAAA